MIYCTSQDRIILKEMTRSTITLFSKEAQFTKRALYAQNKEKKNYMDGRDLAVVNV